MNTDSDNISASKSNSTKSKQRTKEAKPGEPNIPELPRIIQLPASSNDINDMRSAVFIHIYQNLPYSTCLSFISHCSLKTQGSLLSPSGLVLRSHHPPQVAHANSPRQVCRLEMIRVQVRNLRISNRSPIFRFQPFVLGGKSNIEKEKTSFFFFTTSDIFSPAIAHIGRCDILWKKTVDHGHEEPMAL